MLGPEKVFIQYDFVYVIIVTNNEDYLTDFTCLGLFGEGNPPVTNEG